jgi:hypothetical protein
VEAAEAEGRRGFAEATDPIGAAEDRYQKKFDEGKMEDLADEDKEAYFILLGEMVERESFGLFGNFQCPPTSRSLCGLFRPGATENYLRIQKQIPTVEWVYKYINAAVLWGLGPGGQGAGP